MQNASMIAVSALMTRQRAIEVTAHNIANAGTLGFKSERLLFSDWLSVQRNVEAPSGGKQLAYTQERATWREQEDGAITQTGNPLDLAISGAGFFTVDTPAGPRLTRSGRFGLMPDGTIADSEGDALLDTNSKPIQIAAGDTQISIAGDGTVSTENGQLGQIGLVTADDPLKLQAEGDSKLVAQGPTTPATDPKMIQGAVEESNVQPVAEITRMMTAQRTFEFIAQFVEGESQRQQGAIDKILQQRT